jgi:hypothetical protein
MRSFTSLATATALAVGLGTVVLPAAHAYDYPSWGAIAIDHDGGWGRALNFDTVSHASDAALAQCGNAGCKVVVTFTECGAVADGATDYEGRYGRTLAEADAKARTSAHSPTIVVDGCNS